MLNLKAVLKEMGVEASFFGSQDFDVLALAGAKVDSRVCTFIAEEKYIANILSNVELVITREELMDSLGKYCTCIVEDPRTLFFKVHNFLETNSEYARKSRPTIIGKGCTISPLALIASNNVVIGDNVVIEEYVSIKENSVIGDSSVIRAGTIVGGQGFEFKNELGTVFGVKHLGGVRIGANVEVQYNTVIDKAIYPWDDTVLEDYVKVDNLVHIAHSCKIDKRVMIVALSLIGGRVEIGEGAWIGAGATLRNGVRLGCYSRVNMGSVATKSVGDNEAVSGVFAIDHDKFMRLVKRWNQE